MEEDKIKEYVLGGGKLFVIQAIDIIRDGGTRVIKCTNGDYFYVDKKEKTYHMKYPTSSEDLIRDDLLKCYLTERIKVYIEREEERMKHLKSFFTL